MVVQLFLYHLLDVTEVYYHSVRIQLFGTAIDSDNPVVTVQILTLTALSLIHISEPTRRS